MCVFVRKKGPEREGGGVHFCAKKKGGGYFVVLASLSPHPGADTMT